jgi:hypothetical protein
MPFWGRKSEESLPYTPPLDIFNNSTFAWSVRKLRTAYDGPCIRIADLNNAQIDVGFLSNGLIDFSAVEAFVGTGAAYVITYYDQSGSGNNLNAKNFNVALNDKVRNENTSPTLPGLIYVDGLPASSCGTGAADYIFTNQINLGSLFFVGARRLLGAVETVFWLGSSTEGLFTGGSNGSATGWGAFVDGAFGPVNTTENLSQRLWEYVYDSGRSYVWTDGSNSNSKLTSQISGIERGRTVANGGGANFSFGGFYQEYICFSDSKLIDRTSIEANMNSYFSIY